MKSLLISILLFLSACTTIPSGRNTALSVTPPGDLEGKWHVIYFRHAWPQGEKPRWHMDTLIAHQVVAPTLKRYQHQIALWRFHRRAARDEAGHQLRFIFYANDKVADAVQSEIEANDLVRQLRADGRLTSVTHGGFGDESALLEATSDPDWSKAVQRSWPYFIMGVSRTWLELIASVEDGKTKFISDTDTLISRYRDIDAEVTEIWREYGQHAFLHHLSGVYGYKALEVRY